MAKIENIVGTLVSADTDTKTLELDNVNGSVGYRQGYHYELGLNDTEFTDVMELNVVCIVTDGVIKKMEISGG